MPEARIFSIVNGVPLHTVFHYQLYHPDMTEILLKRTYICKSSIHHQLLFLKNVTKYAGRKGDTACPDQTVVVVFLFRHVCPNVLVTA